MSKKSDAEVLLRLSQDTAKILPHDVLARVSAQLLSDAHDEEKYAHLQGIGKSAAESIRDMVAALECDYDRLEELKEAREAFNSDASEPIPSPDEDEELAELISAAGECESREDAKQRITEDALSVQVRSDWHEPEEVSSPPGQFEILLSTGGPATRIIGDLDEDGEPTSATLQAKNFGQPWTDYNGCKEMPHSAVCELCLTYAQQFYFGQAAGRLP